MSEILRISVETETLIRILGLSFLGFMVSMLITPIFTKLAYEKQWWKTPKKSKTNNEVAEVVDALHAERESRLIPTMAGVIIVVSVVVVTVLFNLSRVQTWLPVAAFACAGIVGLIDDWMKINRPSKRAARLPSKRRLFVIGLIALLGGWYFFAKLDITTIQVPFYGDFALGWLVVPLFVLVVVATANAVNISDGLDGLAGGLATYAFAAYAVIAFVQEQYGIAAFCMTIVGALLSYTWFNIAPARFFMGSVGSFSLGTALAVVAMLTDAVILLLVIGVVFVIEAGSVVLQFASRRLRSGKKILKLSPAHHHFVASGWPDTKVTMRFWVIGQVAGVVGLILFLLGHI